MRPLAPSVLLLCLASLHAAPAPDSLREIVHPSADRPAFRCLVPADWHSEVDATGNLQLANPARTAFFSLSFAHAADPAGAIDALARAVLGDSASPPWESREPVEISGHAGFCYTARIKAGDAMVRAELLIVQVDERHLASCSLIRKDRIKPDDDALARLVQAGVKLVATP